MNIPFNKPSLAGNELEYIQDAISLGHISGDGNYTKKCKSLLETELDVIKLYQIWIKKVVITLLLQLF